jgi:hypothetical protein
MRVYHQQEATTQSRCAQHEKKKNKNVPPFSFKQKDMKNQMTITIFWEKKKTKNSNDL